MRAAPKEIRALVNPQAVYEKATVLMYGLHGLAESVKKGEHDNLDYIAREVEAFSMVALDLHEICVVAYRHAEGEMPTAEGGAQ